MTNTRRRAINPMAISASINAPRPLMKGTTAIETMADDLRVIDARAGGATADDLALVGWTPAQITKHSADAIARAASLSNILI